MSREDADEWKSKGNDAFSAGAYNSAIEYYTYAIELDPANAALFSNRAAAYTKIEEYQRAKYDADMCIDLKPDWPKGYWRKGTAELEAQEYKAAIKTFELGLERNPTDQNLVEGKRKAISMAAVVDSVVGDEYGEFDIDGPGKKQQSAPQDSDAPEVSQSKADLNDMADADGKEWPGSLEQEVSRILDASNHYDILNVPATASEDLLKKHYHTLARMLHPDKCNLPRGEDAMKNVSIAYNTLKSEQKRKKYDAYLEARNKNGETTETFAEWDARQMQPTNIPPFLEKILQYRGCALLFIILVMLILLPLVIIIIIVALIVYLICIFPKELVLRCCFPEKWEEYKHEKEEQNRRNREKADEDFQDMFTRNL